MKKILIIGINSYIGSSFNCWVNEHYSGNYEVDAISVRDNKWKELSFGGYDSILYTAGIVHSKETKKNAQLYYEVNRDLTYEVARKAKEEGVKQFVFLSSMSVYNRKVGKIDRNTITSPTTNYGKSKLQAEMLLNELSDENFKVATIRPPMVYGRGCKGNYQTLSKIARKFSIFPYVSNKRSMIYVDNLSEFIRLLIDNDESGLFFPQNSEYSNTSDMVKAIATVHNKKVRIVKGFGWLIKFMGLFVNAINKAFGSLVYDKDISCYKDEYETCGLQESINRTETI